LTPIRSIPAKLPTNLAEQSKQQGFIFIDANQYLTLYRVIKGKKLLEALIEQRDHIFVTQQIVDEVQRNKLSVAEAFFEDHFKSPTLGKELSTFNIPDHLFDLSADTEANLHKIVDPIAKNSQQIKNALKKAASETLERISRSQDKISMQLSPLFKRGVRCNQEELDKARARRERGNPPGKQKDPLGDQISWEQVLNRYKTAPRMWLITHDSDFCLEREGKSILNPFLYAELETISSGPPLVHCFSGIDNGIRDFTQTHGVVAKNLPTERESRAIQAEWNAASNAVSATTSTENAILTLLERYRNVFGYSGAQPAELKFLSELKATHLPAQTGTEDTSSDDDKK
jgi:hypothetical protein